MGRCLFPTYQQILLLPSPHLHLPFFSFTTITWYCLFWASRYSLWSSCSILHFLLSLSESVHLSMLICPSLALFVCPVKFPTFVIAVFHLYILHLYLSAQCMWGMFLLSFMTDLYFSVRILSPPLVFILGSYLCGGSSSVNLIPFPNWIGHTCAKTELNTSAVCFHLKAALWSTV